MQPTPIDMLENADDIPYELIANKDSWDFVQSNIKEEQKKNSLSKKTLPTIEEHENRKKAQEQAEKKYGPNWCENYHIDNNNEIKPVPKRKGPLINYYSQKEKPQLKKNPYKK